MIIVMGYWWVIKKCVFVSKGGPKFPYLTIGIIKQDMSKVRWFQHKIMSSNLLCPAVYWHCLPSPHLFNFPLSTCYGRFKLRCAYPFIIHVQWMPLTSIHKWQFGKYSCCCSRVMPLFTLNRTFFYLIDIFSRKGKIVKTT